MADKLAKEPRQRAEKKTVGSTARWPQIEATTLADRVYQIVRNRILQRELAPGTFIREQEVSRATGVSRTPVREALNRLASQDFLDRVPHRGFRVPDSPWETLLEIYPIVTALEMLAGSLSFEGITPADLRKLKELNRKLEQAAEDGDPRPLVEYNNAFHKVFSDRSGNTRLAELLDQLRAQVILLDVWYFSVPENVKLSVGEHDEIVQALEAGDHQGALDGLRRNYIRGGQALENEMSKNGMRPR
jgi:DNA-binding GntR family transcriptional regulator